MIIAVCTLVGVVEVADSAAYDYQLQVDHIELVEGFNHAHIDESQAQPAGDTQRDECVGTSAAKQSTLGLHVRAVTHATALLLITNTVLVGWLLVVGGDRLGDEPDPTRPTEHNHQRGGPRGGLGLAEARAVRPTTIPALAGIGAGAIHASAVGAHADHRVLATIFVVMAVLQLATGVALLVQPGRAVAKAVVAINAFAVAGWLLTRTVGVWLIAGLGVERPGVTDTVCALLGGLAAVGAWLVLGSETRSGVTSKWRPATGGRELAAASMVVVLLAVPAMSSAATSIHEHGAIGAEHAMKPWTTRDRPSRQRRRSVSSVPRIRSRQSPTPATASTRTVFLSAVGE